MSFSPCRSSASRTRSFALPSRSRACRRVYSLRQRRHFPSRIPQGGKSPCRLKSTRLIPEAQDLLRQGQMSRRDFIRVATLLGASVAGASALAACGAPAPAPAAADPGCRATAAPVATVAPTAAPKAGPVRGGVITARGRVDRASHPAQFSLVSQSHPWRHVLDYLTYTNEKGITRPVHAGEVVGQRRSEDLDPEPQEGHQVQRRPGVQRRRRRLQLRPVAEQGRGFVAAGPDELPASDGRREGRRLHGQAELHRPDDLRARAPLPVPGRDRAQDASKATSPSSRSAPAPST